MTTVPIVGAHFHPPAKVLLEVLAVGSDLILRREPENIHDPNAISVWVPSGMIPNPDGLDDALRAYGTSWEELQKEPDHMLGYVSRGLAEALAPDFPLRVDFPGEFSVGPNGGPRARFDLGVGHGS